MAGVGAEVRGKGTEGVSARFISGADSERDRLGDPGVSDDEAGGMSGELGAVGELATALDLIGGPQNQSTHVSPVISSTQDQYPPSSMVLHPFCVEVF
jgi:hypothetical protein